MINLPTLQLSDEGQPAWSGAWPGHVTNSVAAVPRAAAAAALVQRTWRSVRLAVHTERKEPNKHTEWLTRRKKSTLKRTLIWIGLHKNKCKFPRWIVFFPSNGPTGKRWYVPVSSLVGNPPGLLLKCAPILSCPLKISVVLNPLCCVWILFHNAGSRHCRSFWTKRKSGQLMPMVEQAKLCTLTAN